MVETILVFALVVFDSILILYLVMAKIISISVVYSFFLILQILCKFQSIVKSLPVTGAKLKGRFYEWQLCVILRENIYILKNIATILFILQYLLLDQT